MDAEFPLIGVLLSGGFGCLAIMFLCIGLLQWPKVEWSSVTFGAAAFLCTVGSIQTLAALVSQGSSDNQYHALNLEFHPTDSALAFLIGGAILWIAGVTMRLFDGGRLNTQLLEILTNVVLSTGFRRRGRLPWDRSDRDD
jgi:hypothetical protein